jgi:putative intracellular protease/amidase
MVLTSHDVLGNTGRKTGFWLEEFAAPYFTFHDAGVELTLASPKGGQPPVDPKSDLPENHRFHREVAGFLGAWQAKQVLCTAASAGFPSLNCANPQIEDRHYGMRELYSPSVL